MPARQKLIDDKHNHHDAERDQKIDHGSNHRTRRDNHTGKIHFRDQVGIADQAIAGLAEGIAKKLPGHHTCKDHQHVWGCARSGQFGYPVKDYVKYNSREYRPDH